MKYLKDIWRWCLVAIAVGLILTASWELWGLFINRHSANDELVEVLERNTEQMNKLAAQLECIQAGGGKECLDE